MDIKHIDLIIAKSKTYLRSSPWIWICSIDKALGSRSVIGMAKISVL